MLSLVIPVYKNSQNIPDLLTELTRLHRELVPDLEVVFVVDGSPDDSYMQLASRLSTCSFPSQLLLLSRNFGSFAAIRAGLAAGRGEHLAVMAADLQEPVSVIGDFDRILSAGTADVVIGTRTSRDDPAMTRMTSGIFWRFYKRFVQKDVPDGGLDIFGCTAAVRDTVLALKENNSSLVGLLLWVGYRRAFVPYQRARREIGRSAWTFSKKLRYLTDSVYAFTDLPIRLLTLLGVFGLLASTALACVVLVVRVVGGTVVPGYAATILVVVFFGALNCFGLGTIGNYVWRAFENTKHRPNYVVASQLSFAPERHPQMRDS